MNLDPLLVPVQLRVSDALADAEHRRRRLLRPRPPSRARRLALAALLQLASRLAEEPVAVRPRRV